MLIPSPSLEQFRQIILSETSLLIEEVWDSAKAALIGEIAKASKKNILILQAAADERFLSDLPFFDLPFFEFPSWETLPGEEIPPSSDIVGKRLQILHALARGKERKLLVCSLQAALQKVPHPSLLQKKCALWKKGDAIPFSSVADFLVSIGYRKAPIASDKGEFAMRGGIVDIFPISSFDPVRIEFFGDVIDQIRTFDPVSQKSSGKIDAVFLAPASELELLKSDKNWRLFSII